MSAYAVDIVSDLLLTWVCKLDCHLEMEDCMGMIDDQTTGPWIKKNQQRENISVILKVIIISNINVKKTTFVFVLIMISFVQNIWD